ncbi:MAG: hypothetical protein GX862_10660, partial [Leucobacter sp.]|nr:hypothetical protein [Leucobacter sp.]
ALQFAAQGLALAPEDLDLLALHADLTTVNAQPTTRYDTITQSATQVAQMSKLLANFPQHTQARRVLFHELWWQRALLIDAPLILLSIVALTIGAAFRASGSVTAIVTGTIVTAIFGIIRLVTYAVVCGKAVPGFRRLLFRELPASRLVRVLIITSWNTIGLAALAMIFVRDAIAIRWLIVMVGIGVVAALVASIAWQLQFWSGATRVGGFSADPDSLSRLRDQRSQLNTRIFYRTLGAGVLALCTFAAVTGRDDAVAIVWLGCGSLVLSPIIGVLAVRRAERGLLDELPEATSLARNYRAPRLVTGALLAAVGVLALGLTLSGISQLPVLPNAHDADGSYTLGSSASSGSTSASGTDACRGRPAARLACMIERNKERQQGWQMPEVTVPDFQVPDFEVSQLDLPDVGEWADEG